MKIQQLWGCFTILLFLLGGVIGLAVWIYQMPNYVTEAKRKHTFTVNADFATVRRSLQRDDLMQEILQANGGYILEKRWTGFRLDGKAKPGEKARKWTLRGTMNAKVCIPDTDGGEMEADLRQDLAVSADAIDAEVRLVKPLPVGITNMKQVLRIRPDRDRMKTRVELELDMRFQRKIPFTHYKYAKRRLEEAADKQVGQVEPALTQLIERYR